MGELSRGFNRADAGPPAGIAGAVLTIDLDALIANYRLLQRQAGGAAVAGVVKADAYGLGAATVAPALAEAGCRQFFVAQLSEAVPLRPLLPDDATLYVLNGLAPGSEAYAALHGIVPVLNTLASVERWAALGVALGRRLPAVLQVDSGMARLGLSADDVGLLAREDSWRAPIDLRLVMSHLACADEPSAAANAAQFAMFAGLADAFPGVPRSLSNSAGIFLGKARFDLVRAGIALYGGAPSDAPNPMLPVVSLEARIVQLRDLPVGRGLGYGLTGAANHPRRIATVGVGYADGWPRHLSNRGSAFIDDLRVPIVGRVSMDSLMIDVSGIPASRAVEGAMIELLGQHQRIDNVAADAGTISYEILTQLGHRYERIYRSSRAQQT